MAKFNLDSPNGILAPCNPESLASWFELELQAIKSSAIREILKLVQANIDEFISWPAEAILFWQGCDRIKPPGSKQKYHRYPEPLKRLAAAQEIQLDTRPNGPAIAAFLFAKGNRHQRFGSSNAWSIHHLYSGKFPFNSNGSTLHSSKSGLHFTQSAGLVAVHPVADSMCDEFPFLTWYLRAEAFRRFGYDPDSVFGRGHNEFGFSENYSCCVLHKDF